MFLFAVIATAFWSHFSVGDGHKTLLRHVTRVSEGNTLPVSYWESSTGRKLTSSEWCFTPEGVGWGVFKPHLWGAAVPNNSKYISHISSLLLFDIYFVSTHTCPFHSVNVCVCVLQNIRGSKGNQRWGLSAGLLNHFSLLVERMQRWTG